MILTAECTSCHGRGWKRGWKRDLARGCVCHSTPSHHPVSPSIPLRGGRIYPSAASVVVLILILICTERGSLLSFGQFHTSSRCRESHVSFPFHMLLSFGTFAKPKLNKLGKHRMMRSSSSSAAAASATIISSISLQL